MRTTLIQAREQSSQQHGNGNFTSIIKGNKVSLIEGDSVVLDAAFLDTRTKTADRINLEEDLTLKFNVVQYTMNSNWRFKSYFGINNATSGLSTNGASLLNTMKPAYLGKWINADDWGETFYLYFSLYYRPKDQRRPSCTNRTISSRRIAR